ncbi:MAG: CNNM domain-containing protein [Gemmatimonadota bacterium]|nr:CNNM domain-containing protein [Gemmatimonadota bacterium]
MSAVLLFLVLAVAWLTAAATAVRTVSRIWLRHWVEQKLTGSATAEVYLARPPRLLLAAGTGIAGLTLGIGVVAATQTDSALALAETLAASAVLLLVVGQSVPRAIARRWGMELVPVLLPALHGLGLIVSPILLLAEWGARAVARPAPERPDDPLEALEDLLREGELEGVGEAEESAIISGVVEFGGKRVRDVMTARDRMVAVDRALPPREIARRMADTAFSRIPVIDGNLDTVIGMIHSFDVLERPTTPAARIRRVAFASPDLPCLDLMRTMLRERHHLAIVRDAAGRTVGLATLEDLVEELVGDIHDEHDDAAGRGSV